MPKFHSTTRCAPQFFAALLGLGLIVGSLSWQTLQLLQFTHPQAQLSAAASAPLSTRSAHNMPALQTLFGHTSSIAQTAPHDLALRLLACFVGPDSQQAVALIALDNQPARRLRIGEQIAPGVQLSAIQERQITITHQGQPYSVRLTPNNPAINNQASNAAPYRPSLITE